MHEKHAADPLPSVLDGIPEGVAGLHNAGINAHEGERADEGVVHDLEGEGGEGLVVGIVALDLFVGVGLHAFDRRHVGRRRQIGNDGVQQGLNALVLEGGTAENGHDSAADRAGAHASLEGFLVGFGTVEVGLHNPVVVLHHRLDQLLAEFGGLGGELFGNVIGLEIGADGLFLPGHRPHSDEIDDAGEPGLLSHGQLHDQGPGAEAVGRSCPRSGRNLRPPGPSC